jgi:hypothetical protein
MALHRQRPPHEGAQVGDDAAQSLNMKLARQALGEGSDRDDPQQLVVAAGDVGTGAVEVAKR